MTLVKRVSGVYVDLPAGNGIICERGVQTSSSILVSAIVAFMETYSLTHLHNIDCQDAVCHMLPRGPSRALGRPSSRAIITGRLRIRPLQGATAMLPSLYPILRTTPNTGFAIVFKGSGRTKWRSTVRPSPSCASATPETGTDPSGKVLSTRPQCGRASRRVWK